MVLREFRKRFIGKRPSLFKSGLWHFHLDNAPVYNSIFVTDYLTRMGINTLPIVETLLPVTFGYSLSSVAVVMRQLRRWKRLWRRSLPHSHKRTSIGPSRSCWNGTTSATSAHTKKSLETYRMYLVNCWQDQNIKTNSYLEMSSLENG